MHASSPVLLLFLDGIKLINFVFIKECYAVIETENGASSLEYCDETSKYFTSHHNFFRKNKLQ